ncbi:MAG TPA: dethiobiotin synthase [Acidimicrobiia bacterium]|nr:dethiobiotin synthase [Acidimicrobiia bacterium]
MIQFVTGTDTGVGKTVACAALALQSRADGLDVRYFKPVQTGLGPDEPGDVDFVTRVTGVEGEEGARFREALAPAVAARMAGATVDVDALRQQALALHETSDLLIVEGAGGLLVPLSDDVDMAEFARSLSADLVVVARPGLGTLNHTALTLEAARSRGFDPVVVVSNWPVDPGLTETTNLEALREMAPVLGLVPAIPDLDVESGLAPFPPALVPA